MSTIVFASPKGGAGKSTSAVLLATQLAETGKKVAVIDAATRTVRSPDGRSGRASRPC